MSPEPLSAEMPDPNAIADQLLQTARVTKISSQSDPLRVNDRVAALKRALAPDVEGLIFADGDIIAWRVPEAMTTETVHRTATCWDLSRNCLSIYVEMASLTSATSRRELESH